MQQSNAITQRGGSLLLLLLLVLGFPLPVFAIAQIQLQALEQIAPGDVAIIQVLLNGGEGLGSLHMTIGYNAEFLSDPQVTAGELGEGASITTNVDQPGMLRVQMSNPQGINGSGQLLELEFGTDPSLTTPLPLSITAQGFNLDEQPMPVRTLGTTIAILPVAPSDSQPAQQEEERQQEEEEKQQEEQRTVRRPPSASTRSPIEEAIRFEQEPEIILSDGEEVATVRVTFDRKGGGGALNLSYSLLNGELVRRPLIRDQSVEFKILPSPGTTRTVLYILGQESLQPIELQVFPPADIHFDRSMLLQEMGKKVGKDPHLRRYDLNNDGIIDDSDLAIFSANYEKKRQ